jgi:hypothetical protein
MTGDPSVIGFQLTGGEAGGEIKNCLTGGGSWRVLDCDMLGIRGTWKKVRDECCNEGGGGNCYTLFASRICTYFQLKIIIVWFWSVMKKMGISHQIVKGKHIS